MQGFAGWYHSFWPQAILTSRRDRLVACIGAGLGLMATEWLSRRALHAPDHRTTDRPPSERVGISRADLHAVLAERGELLDISEDDLQEILLQAEVRSHGRRSSALR